jgi:hypothetical protein
VWLEADVRITGYAFLVIAYSLEADVDCSLQKIRQMTRTRMCTNSLSISSRALWAARLFPPVFQYIPSMLASYDWRLRHAGLMEIAPIGEGTSKARRCWLFVFGEWGCGYADLVEDIGYAERLGNVVE